MFPYTNEMNISFTLGNHVMDGTTNGSIIEPDQYLGFHVPRPVDVSGLQVGLGINLAGGTPVAAGVGIPSGTTTVVMNPYDGGTTGSAPSGTNNLFGNDDFSNSIAGGWTFHSAQNAIGTSTTDLNADDWVNIDFAANITGVGGFGQAVFSAHILYGVPGAPG